MNDWPPVVFGPLGDGTWRGWPSDEMTLDIIELGERVALALEDEGLGYGPLFDEQARLYFESCRPEHLRKMRMP